MQQLEGVYATAKKDSSVLLIEYDDGDVTTDVRQLLSQGDGFRIGE